MVIKDHRIAEVLVVGGDEDWGDNQDAFDALTAKWQPLEYERSWWPDEAWALKEAEDARREAERKASYERNRCRLKHRHDFSCELKAYWPKDEIQKLTYDNSPFLSIDPRVKLKF